MALVEKVRQTTKTSISPLKELGVSVGEMGKTVARSLHQFKLYEIVAKRQEKAYINSQLEFAS